MIDFSKYPAPNVDLTLALYDVLHELRMPEYEPKRGSAPEYFFAAMHRKVLAPDYVAESHYLPWHNKIQDLFIKEVWSLTDEDRKVFLFHDLDLADAEPNMEGKFEYMQSKAPFASLLYEYNFESFTRDLKNRVLSNHGTPEFAITHGAPEHDIYQAFRIDMLSTFSRTRYFIDNLFKDEESSDSDLSDFRLLSKAGYRELCRLLSVGFILQDPTEEHIQRYKEGLHFHFGYIKKLKTLDRKIAREWATL